jgi:hypothetical protein
MSMVGRPGKRRATCDGSQTRAQRNGSLGASGCDLGSTVPLNPQPWPVPHSPTSHMHPAFDQERWQCW